MSINNNNNVPKSMEEVWKDIGGLNHMNPPPNNNNNGVILQDFFSRDINININIPSTSPPPPPPQPPTILTLSSIVPDHHHHHHFISSLHQHPINSHHYVSSSLLLDAGRKRFQPESDRVSGGGDRRHKRMIKNRESAARSRARKQAYTNELELEVANLLEENAKLKKQQQQLYLAAAAQHQRKKSLHRTSTAPF